MERKRYSRCKPIVPDCDVQKLRVALPAGYSIPVIPSAGGGCCNRRQGKGAHRLHAPTHVHKFRARGMSVAFGLAGGRQQHDQELTLEDRKCVGSAAVRS